jgi:LacI family transcriptional regulator
MPRFLTMGEMARELGLSRLTVSSVVSGRFRERGISEATAVRVREHLAKRGYVPSRSAQELRTGVRDALGILYGGRLYSHLIEAFNEIVGRYNQSERRLETIIVPDGGAADGFRELIARGVSEAIWLHRRPAELECADPEAILAHLGRVRLVIYNFRSDDPRWNGILEEHGVCRVGVDREDGFRRLGALLKSLGHTVVAVPHPEKEAELTRAPEGLSAAGLKVRMICPPDLAWEASPAFAAAMAERIVLAMRQDGATACAFLDDALAGFTMLELISRGVRIPADLTVTGFDGMPFAAFTPVPLTTLAVPVAKMVACAEQMLKKDPSRKERCFPLELIERRSHGPAPRRTAGRADC